MTQPLGGSFESHSCWIRVEPGHGLHTNRADKVWSDGARDAVPFAGGPNLNGQRKSMLSQSARSPTSVKVHNMQTSCRILSLNCLEAGRSSGAAPDEQDGPTDAPDGDGSEAGLVRKVVAVHHFDADRRVHWQASEVQHRVPAWGVGVLDPV